MSKIDSWYVCYSCGLRAEYFPPNDDSNEACPECSSEDVFCHEGEPSEDELNALDERYSWDEQKPKKNGE